MPFLQLFLKSLVLNNSYVKVAYLGVEYSVTYHRP